VRSLLVLLAACAGPTSLGDPLDDPQLPPRGSEDVMTWIEAGHYLDWTCETEVHPARAGSGHGPNRICSNDTLVGSSGDGVFPVGAAAVKEVYTAGTPGEAIRLWAVYRKVEAASGGDSWYWFEGTRTNIVANGEGDGTCTGCHSSAPRDFVFTVP
jgi:hypothetical protein